MAEEIIPIFVFDERVFEGKTRFGFSKTGPYRAKFIMESVQDLQQSLKKLGSDLLIRTGKPEEILVNIAREYKCSWVICNRERTFEEVTVQDALEKGLWGLGIELIYVRGKMLYHTQDLPMPVQHIPDVFSQFRKETEGITQVRLPLPRPDSLAPMPPELRNSSVPNLADFGLEEPTAEDRGVLPFHGGESHAIHRLQHYFWESNSLKSYKETRNGLIGPNYSSKFSPWLSCGCISPKFIYHEIKRFEAERGANESTYWLFFELLWRDFFRLIGKKHGNKIFLKGGTQNKPMRHLKNNIDLFQLWAEGNTGVPFIDANMRELNATGWMSNRGRQNVAGFLVKDLKVNWQIGAEYFESMLLDYDPCSNWGNWNYVAGVGSDPREDRYFNILTQAKNYDAQGEFVKRWCPELQNVPTELIHRPDLLSSADRQKYKLSGYPKAIVQIKKWV
jgi:deoxyribodipyrimidine photo-lyase